MQQNMDRRMMKPRDIAALAEPKGMRKLSGKRIGFGRHSGKRLRTEEAIRLHGETFRLNNGGTVPVFWQVLCLRPVFYRTEQKRSEYLWN